MNEAIAKILMDVIKWKSEEPHDNEKAMDLFLQIGMLIGFLNSANIISTLMGENYGFEIKMDALMKLQSALLTNAVSYLIELNKKEEKPKGDPFRDHFNFNPN